MPEHESFSRADTADAIYRAIDDAIAGLTSEKAMALLEEVAGHIDGMIEGIKEETP